MSPFGYNETTAQEFFPLSAQRAQEEGFNWREKKDREYAVSLKSENLPDISRVDDSITNEIIACADAGKCEHQCSSAFRIIPQELQFYRQLKIPLPALCPNCRHGERLLQRNSIIFSHRACGCAGGKSANGVYENTAHHAHGQDSCPNEFETSYPPESGKIVYCEQCYQAEVV